MKEVLDMREYINGVVEKYSDMLIRAAFLHMKNTADAEEVVQDVFLKLIQKPRDFESEEHEKAWLIRVTINLCRDRLRLAWFKKRAPLDENLQSIDDEKNEIISEVMSLPVKYRSIILLFYYENYTIAEVSKVLNIRETTVGSQLYRARKLLKNKLEGKFIDGREPV